MFYSLLLSFVPGRTCVLPANVWIVGSGLNDLPPSLGVEDVFLVSGLLIQGPVWWYLGGPDDRCPGASCLVIG